MRISPGAKLQKLLKFDFVASSCEKVIFVSDENYTAVFKKVATFNIDFASRDGNRAHQNTFRSYDGNFVRQTIEIERIKDSDSQIERTLLRFKKSLAMS